MTSEVKMCKEVPSLSLQLYLQLGNSTVLEGDHEAAQGSLMIISSKVVHELNTLLFPLPSSPCPYH